MLEAGVSNGLTHVFRPYKSPRLAHRSHILERKG